MPELPQSPAQNTLPVTQTEEPTRGQPSMDSREAELRCGKLELETQLLRRQLSARLFWLEVAKVITGRIIGVAVEKLRDRNVFWPRLSLLPSVFFSPGDAARSDSSAPQTAPLLLSASVVHWRIASSWAGWRSSRRMDKNAKSTRKVFIVLLAV
jgi:hypothetical protein